MHSIKPLPLFSLFTDIKPLLGLKIEFFFSLLSQWPIKGIQGNQIVSYLARHV